MKIDELQNLWTAGTNQPTSAQRDQLIARFTTSLRRRRRQELFWLVWTFSVLALLTGFAAWIVFATDKVRLTAEWAVIPLLLIPWAFAFLFLRKFLRQKPKSRGDLTISASLTDALAVNASERFKMKALGVMYLIVLPVLAFSIWQLHSVGKVSSRELISMITFLGTALSLSAGAVLFRYWFRLVPNGQKLKGLLSQFEQLPE